MASRPIALKDMASKPFVVGVFGDEAEVLLFVRVEATKGDVL